MKIGTKLTLSTILLLTIALLAILGSIGFIVQQEQVTWGTGLTIILGIGVILISLFIMYPLSRSLAVPLMQINEHLKMLAQSQLNEEDIEYRGTDEIAEIVISVRQLKNSMREMIETNAQQNWLKTGQNQLNDQLSGEQNLIKLAENIISFLPPYLEAQIGTFYLAGEGQPQTLRMIASYAYTWRKDLANEFQLGEGIVGQAALERKMIIITNAPEDYIYIQSGLGKSLPSAILVLPVLYEGSLKAIIELASFHVFTEIQLEFLEQIAPGIGIALNTAQSRSRMQSLLRESESQKEELEIQAEELQIKQKEMEQSNEELQSQSDELKFQAETLQTKQKELEQTNEELQSQSEELQAQQEELRQTNEELEERTRDLEQQRNEISDKNQSLEQAQQAIEAKAKELEIASKYKSEFLANMSHELRTPLNSLLILTQLLADNKEGNLTDKQVEYARTMHSAGADLLTLINEILDLSKVEAGKMEITVESVSLADLVETLEQKFHHLATEKGIAFKITMTEDLPTVIYTDVQRLQQIITNLLSNSFKFTEQGEVKLAIQRPTTSLPPHLQAAQTVAISVTDTGIGIPQEKQQAIFEAFQQVDGTTSRRYGGTGLGLSISRELVRLLGGEIQLHSEEGKGSTFTIYIPETLPGAQELTSKNRQIFSPKKVSTSNRVSSEISETAKDKPSVSSQNLVSSECETDKQPVISSKHLETPATTILDDRDNLKISDRSLLIIEDDRKFSHILIELAREKGFKCLMAEDGKTGLELAETYKPDAIILDIGLPKMDGWTVMEMLKENPATRHIPVHFMSASDHSVSAKKMGAIGYLLKPVGMTELGEAFKKIEHFIAKTAKNLLVFVEQEPRQQEILELIGSNGIKSTIAGTLSLALEYLNDIPFDCIILDIDSEQGSAIKLLEKLYSEENLSQIPVIIYAERELTESEENVLHQSEANLTVKAVQSPERLLDEATLFLHQVEANMPKEKQNMLRMVHDKEAILTGKKVLLVDDDIRNTFALMTFLDGKDMQVIVGNHGKEALTLLEEHPDINLVLMDIMMPEMDGYDAIRQIRTQARFRKLPIIALTAKAMKGDKIKCIEAGANDYLAKPVDTDKLISLMRVWLYR